MGQLYQQFHRQSFVKKYILIIRTGEENRKNFKFQLLNIRVYFEIRKVNIHTR